MITLQRQLQLLWENVLDDNSDPMTITQVAQKTGLSQQSLSNLLNGHVTDPRLNTLTKLCMAFDISLDYFGYDTEAACLHYLVEYGKVGILSPQLHSIHTEGDTLTADEKRNVLAILQWRLWGTKS
ncbi:MAG: helix-turn-helix transcriptional regulator [Chloroflexota bacterium]|nr:helix-turn-helix transcriptional regulator [Chloroflexota bacterium]